MSVIILVLLIVGFVEYIWCKRKEISMWLDIGGPACPYWFLNPNETIHRLDHLFNKYGSIVSLWMGTKLVVLIGDADLAATVIISPQMTQRNGYNLKKLTSNGILTTNGDTSQHSDNRISPSITNHQLKLQTYNINQHMKTLVGCMSVNIDKTHFDVKPFLQNCVMDWIIDTTMNTQTNFQIGENPQLLKDVDQVLYLAGQRMFNPFMQSRALYRMQRLFKIEPDFFEKQFKPFLKKIITIAADKSKCGIDVQCDKNESVENTTCLINQSNSDRNLTNDDLTDQFMSLIINAYAKTASALSFIIVMLAMHPEHQQRIYDEIDCLQRNTDHDWTPDDLIELKYLDRFVLETLRLFPADACIELTTAEELYVKGKCIIPPGTAVMVDVLHIQRSKKYFKDPDRFDPDNFLPDRVRDRNPFAYFPFSQGHRACTGRLMADAALRIAVVHVLRYYRLSTTSHLTEFPLRFDSCLNSQSGFNIFIKRRA